MQIIVTKSASYIKRRAPWLALCEVVRQTDKRFYVQFIKGDRFALDGRSTAPYVPVDAVLSFDPSDFDAMVAAAVAYEKEVARLDAMEDAAWNAMEAVLKPVKQDTLV